MSLNYEPEQLRRAPAGLAAPPPRNADRIPQREFKLSWREAGPPNHLDNQVDLEQTLKPGT